MTVTGRLVYIMKCRSRDFADEEYGQKSVSVMLDGQETELEIIDHPSAEISVSRRDV